MRIVCDYGYFKFWPESAAELQRFGVTFGRKLVRKKDYYVFESQASLLDYSIRGNLYAGVPALATVSDEIPMMLFRNNITLSLLLDRHVPISSIVDVSLQYVSPRGIVTGTLLPQPGSFGVGGSRLVGYVLRGDIGSGEIIAEELTYDTGL